MNCSVAVAAHVAHNPMSADVGSPVKQGGHANFLRIFHFLEKFACGNIKEKSLWEPFLGPKRPFWDSFSTCWSHFLAKAFLAASKFPGNMGNPVWMQFPIAHLTDFWCTFSKSARNACVPSCEMFVELRKKLFGSSCCPRCPHEFEFWCFLQPRFQPQVSIFRKFSCKKLWFGLPEASLITFWELGTSWPDDFARVRRPKVVVGISYREVFRGRERVWGLY